MSNGIIDYYYEEIHKEQYEPLDDEIVKALFTKYRRTGDITIRDTLITHNLRLVCNVVKKYKGAYNYDQDFIKDIFQAGNIGLIRAVDLFDPEKGYKFSTYAYHCIDTEIIRLIGNSDIMKIGGDKKREIYRLSRAMGKLYQKLCREPSKEELAEFLEISVEELEKKGINNYIIDLLNEFDTCLCNYVLSHSYLLEILRKKFFAIKKKWIYFDLRNRELKIDWIIYYIQDYVKKHEEDFRFPDCFIIGYIAENLDIPELKEYASNTDMEYMETLNIKELNYLNIMLKTIRKIINNNVFEPPEEEQSSSKNSSKKKLK